MATDTTPVIGETAARTARDLSVLVGRLRRRFREAAGNQELTPSQTSVMSLLAKGVSTASALAAHERVRPQAIAATLAALEERGLIERRPDPEDRRRLLVTLSDTGRELHEGRRRAGGEWLASAVQQHYTEAERQTLLTALALLERLTNEQLTNERPEDL